MACRRSGVRSPSAPPSDPRDSFRACCRRRGGSRWLWRRGRAASGGRDVHARGRLAATFPQDVRAWCGPYDDDNRDTDAVHILAGELPRDENPPSFWTVRAVRADRRARSRYDVPERLRLHGAARRRSLRPGRRGQGERALVGGASGREERSGSSSTGATRATLRALTSRTSRSAASFTTCLRSRLRARSSPRSRGSVTACPS